MSQKEVEKVAVVVPVVPSLDAATLAAINAAVVAAVKSAMPVVPVREAVAQSVNPSNFTQNKGYVKKSKGFPVEPGQTWHDLTIDQRKQWFAEHENRWKTRFGIQNAGMKGDMSWTRG